MYMTKKGLFVFCFALSFLFSFQKLAAGAKYTIEEYIDTYKGFAMSEMKRTQIPASIILSQAILESRFGNGYLALKGNNHFGIKCRSNWKGTRIYRKDDAPNECFRKYENATDSYIDHSNLLLNSENYQKLFQYSNNDYENWAAGLKACGYASDLCYTERLLDLIKRYELDGFDYGGKKCSYVLDKEIRVEVIPQIIKYNGLKAMVFTCEVSLKQVVDAYYKKENKKITIGKLNQYNDFSFGRNVPPNTLIFLEQKLNQASCGLETHKVAQNETMKEISQLYGIKLSKLYARNHLIDGHQVASGEVINLRGRRAGPPQIRLGNMQPYEVAPPKPKPTEKPAKKEPILANETANQAQKNKEKIDSDIPKVAANQAQKDSKKVESDIEKTRQEIARQEAVKKASLKAIDIPKPKKNTFETANSFVPQSKEEKSVEAIYVITKGDTLYSIARKFDTDVKALRRANKLKDNTIKVGQQLVIVQE
ncbi:MAG: glucosaminidase domain-containing protein [Chitinophagales bacterium]